MSCKFKFADSPHMEVSNGCLRGAIHSRNTHTHTHTHTHTDSYNVCLVSGTSDTKEIPTARTSYCCGGSKEKLNGERI